MKTTKFLFAALFLLVGLPTAFAASLKDAPGATVERVAHIEPIKDFAGAFVGGSVNWDRLDVDQRGSLDWSACDEGTQCFLSHAINGEHGTTGTGLVNLPGADDDAISFGARIGYLFQVGRIYGGPVAMFDLGGPSAGISYNDGEPFGLTASLEQTVNWKASLVGKAGVQVFDRIGVYGIVGVAFVDVDLDGKAHVGTDGAGFGLTVNHNETLTAFTYGAGVDAKISDRWTGFVEWQRFDLDTFNASGSLFADCLKYGYKGDDTLDTVRVGLTYTFN